MGSPSFYGSDLVFLRRYKLQLEEGLIAIALRQSCEILGRKMTMANQPEMEASLTAVNNEITRQTEVAAGNLRSATRCAYPRFT